MDSIPTDAVVDDTEAQRIAEGVHEDSAVQAVEEVFPKRSIFPTFDQIVVVWHLHHVQKMSRIAISKTTRVHLGTVASIIHERDDDFSPVTRYFKKGDAFDPSVFSHFTEQDKLDLSCYSDKFRRYSAIHRLLRPPTQQQPSQAQVLQPRLVHVKEQRKLGSPSGTALRVESSIELSGSRLSEDQVLEIFYLSSYLRPSAIAEMIKCNGATVHKILNGQSYKNIAGKYRAMTKDELDKAYEACKSGKSMQAASEEIAMGAACGAASGVDFAGAGAGA